jgi:hypothetical protein
MRKLTVAFCGRFELCLIRTETCNRFGSSPFTPPSCARTPTRRFVTKKLESERNKRLRLGTPLSREERTTLELRFRAAAEEKYRNNDTSDSQSMTAENEAAVEAAAVQVRDRPPPTTHTHNHHQSFLIGTSSLTFHLQALTPPSLAPPSCPCTTQTRQDEMDARRTAVLERQAAELHRAREEVEREEVRTRA